MIRLSRLLIENKKIEQKNVCQLLCYEDLKARDRHIGFVNLSRRIDALTDILDYLVFSDVIAVLITLQKLKPKINFYPSQRFLQKLLVIALNEEICFDPIDLLQTLVLPKPHTTLDDLNRSYKFICDIPIELPNTLQTCGSRRRRSTFCSSGIRITLSCNQCQKDKSTIIVTEQGMMFGAICSTTILWKCPVCEDVADTCKEHAQCCVDCGQAACNVCFAGAEFDVVEEEVPLCKNCGFWCTSCLETCHMEDKIVCAGSSELGCPFNHECCSDCVDEMNMQCCDICSRAAHIDCDTTLYCCICNKSTCQSCLNIDLCEMCGYGECDECSTQRNCVICGDIYCDRYHGEDMDGNEEDYTCSAQNLTNCNGCLADYCEQCFDGLICEACGSSWCGLAACADACMYECEDCGCFFCRGCYELHTGASKVSPSKVSETDSNKEHDDSDAIKLELAVSPTPSSTSISAPSPSSPINASVSTPTRTLTFVPLVRSLP